HAGGAEAAHEPRGEEAGEQAADRPEPYRESEGGVAQPDGLHELRVARQDRAEGRAVEEEEQGDGPAGEARVPRDVGAQRGVSRGVVSVHDAPFWTIRSALTSLVHPPVPVPAPHRRVPGAAGAPGTR